MKIYCQSILIVFILTCFNTAHAQQNATQESGVVGPPAPVTFEQLTEDSVKAKRLELAAKIEAATKTLETATVAGATEIIQAKIQILDRHDFIISQQLSALQQNNSLQTSKQLLEEQREKYKTAGPEGEAPYSYLMLDTMRTELKTQNEKSATLDSSIQAVQSAVDQAKTRVSEAEAARRSSLEQLANNTTPIAQLRHDNFILEVAVANDVVRLRQLELNNLKTEKELHLERIVFQEQRMKDIALDVRFREEDLNEQLLKIDGQVQDLDKQRKDAETTLNNFVIPEQAKAQREYQNDSSLLNYERMQLAISKHSLNRDKVDIFTIRRDRTQQRKQFWEHRHQTINGLADYTQLQTWKNDINNLLEDYQLQEHRTKQDISYLQSTFDTIDTKIESNQDNKALLDVFHQQQATIKEHITVKQTNISSINASRDVVQKLLEEINTELNIWTWEDVFNYSWKIAGEFLDQEITHYVDANNFDLEGKPLQVRITYGKVVIALSIFIFGWIITRFISKFLGYLLLNRFNVEEGIVVTIRSLFFYFVVAILVPISLKTVSVDLTAFAFLGGALAIAVGFGSQNIFSNFISGIIMLVERPVRVGDVVEVEGVSGKITQIGLRSTLLNTWDNQDVVIPNNYFLENRVTNFTLENWVIRAIIDVGVAYGSDTRLVQKLLRKAIDEHGLILKFPEPIVIFNAFGESSLDFRLYFWVDMKACNRLVVCSDLRHRINKLFQENDIEIPFPQRDLHFRSGNPVDVRILNPNEETAPQLEQDGTNQREQSTSTDANP